MARELSQVVYFIRLLVTPPKIMPNVEEGTQRGASRRQGCAASNANFCTR